MLTADLYEAVYVLHAFAKKTQRTSGADIELARQGATTDRLASGDPMKAVRSGGNVFEDLRFRSGEAQNLRVRAQLMAELRDFIRDARLTQARAAAMFGVSQPRISNLVRGKIDLFTIGMLVNMLAGAGRKVEVKTRRGRAA